MAILQKTLTTILASSIFAISSFAAVDNNQENESCNFSINDAWIRPAQSGNTALYMNIKANTDAGKDASLISASVYSLTNDGKAIPDVTGDVELHDTKDENGTIKMFSVKAMQLENGSLTLEPKKKHIMLMHLKKSLTEVTGANPATVNVRLAFSDGSVCKTTAVIRSAGASK